VREILAHSEHRAAVSHLYLDLRHECLHESQAATSHFVARSWSFPHAAICDDHEELVVVVHSSHCDLSAKLRVLDRVYYPDVIIACEGAAEVELMVEEPSLVVEVTSPSTQATDRREKLEAYMRIASLRVYLIVDQRRKHVIVYSRDAAGEWLRDEMDDDGTVEIPFLQTSLTLTEIYDDVTLPPLRVREGEEWDADEWVETDAE